MSDPAPIDTERLVADLRERVARIRAAGGYADDVSAVPVVIEPPAARVAFRPELAYSSKPVIGPLITAVKRLLVRTTYHVHADMARQADVAVATVEGQARAAQDEARAARSEAHAAQERIDGTFEAEVGAREELAARVAARLDALERLDLVPRLARLERAARAAASAPPAAAAPVAPAAPAAAGGPAEAVSGAGGAPFDYLAFEARFRGSEESVAARQSVYRDVLRDRRRVVDIGCGRGELLEMLRDEGVSAYGVEIEPDFLALLHEKGLEAVEGDAIAHLEGLEPGAVDAVVASHVVEHLPPAVLTRLVAAAADALPEGGVLALETPNPESLVAGSVNFHRDLTHLRPVHPDTLAFLCESAGFREVRILRLAPMAPEEMLPAGAPGGGELAAHVDRVVERLNALLYGFQDYAVVARR
jgi:O-antigen chain-terminating methyltransferase